ncbi:MAG: glutamate-5-semialdehyde dehydrogenase [Clostridia bacterium]|nr:glutamate-5-semialdehyde dehydrogenase [Clostridia bacterium]
MSTEEVCALAKAASYRLATKSDAEKNAMLIAMANGIDEESEQILLANNDDVFNAQQNGKDETFIERLVLYKSRIRQMIEGIMQVAELPDPVGEVTDKWTLPNGLSISKVRAPLGVIAIIYEARPNVTCDAAALAIKSGNAVILRGSREAINSNLAVFNAMKNALLKGGYDAEVLQFLPEPDREVTAELLKQNETVDVVIPRGGEGLKKFVMENSSIPVIASAGGNCHTYVEKTADLKIADNVLFNAKVSRPSVCNATEQLIVDRAIAAPFLSKSLERLSRQGVRILGCPETCRLYPIAELATEDDYYAEHLGLILSVKVVSGYKEAIERINKYGTHHSDAIISTSNEAIEAFKAGVDSAAVYVNASTRFTDGFEFGFGAEMAISTQKLHARGPLGLKQLTSEKYVIVGEGQVRK